jgi:hypothetical protein
VRAADAKGAEAAAEGRGGGGGVERDGVAAQAGHEPGSPARRATPPVRPPASRAGIVANHEANGDGTARAASADEADSPVSVNLNRT